MKKIFLTLGLFILFFQVFPQGYEEKLDNILVDQSGYSISTTQVANLSEGSTAYHYKTCYGGLDYAVGVFCDENGVRDMDVYVYDGDGNLLISDNDTSPLGYVTFHCNYDTTIKIVMKLYSADSASKQYYCKMKIYYN